MSPVSSTRKPAHTGGGTNPAGMETGGSKKLKKKGIFPFSRMEKEERAVPRGSLDGEDSLDIPEGLGGSCLTQGGSESLG